MKILIGKVFSWLDDSPKAIEIPKLGVITAKVDEDGFEYIELSKKQLRELQKVIEKELAKEED